MRPTNSVVIPKRIWNCLECPLCENANLQLDNPNFDVFYCSAKKNVKNEDNVLKQPYWIPDWCPMKPDNINGER